MRNLFDLSGRVAIVTGGSRGLGAEFAEGLAEAGASLMLCARRDEWLVPGAESLRARGFTVDEMRVVEPMRQRAFVGDASQVANKLRKLAAELEMDELVINTWAHDPQVRRHSYSLLAREFGLAQTR